MRKVLVLIGTILWGLLGLSPIRFQVVAEAGPRLSFAEWTNTCGKLPSNRALGDRMPPSNLLPLKDFGELDATINDFNRQCVHGTLGDTKLWVGELPTTNGFFNLDTAYFLKPTSSSAMFVERFIPHPRNAAAAPPFQPFAAKLVVNEGAEIFFHADLHGDIRSLIGDLDWLNRQGYLTGFKIAKPGFYMIFSGDYADRGHYGVEVFYTLLRLKLANRDQVFLLRGNHEEISIAARYGFLSEGIIKYGAAFDVQKVARVYDFLPVVLYAGSSGNYIQCHHGGMEPGFDPRSLLDAPSPLAFQFLGALNQRQFLNTHQAWAASLAEPSRSLIQSAYKDFRPDDPISPTTTGFMWNDFSVLASEPEFSIDPGRAFVYGPKTVSFLLQQSHTGKSSLQAVFRGHQQSPSPNRLMNRIIASHGVFRHWQESESSDLSAAGPKELADHLDTNSLRTIPSGSVWTFNMAPDSMYGEGNHYTFDTFGIVTTAKSFTDWRLKVVNVEIGL